MKGRSTSTLLSEKLVIGTAQKTMYATEATIDWPVSTGFDLGRRLDKRESSSL